HEPGRTQYCPVDTKRGETPLIGGVCLEVRLILAELAGAIIREKDNALGTGSNSRIECVAVQQLQFRNRRSKHKHAFCAFERLLQGCGHSEISDHRHCQMSNTCGFALVSDQRLNASAGRCELPHKL